MTEIQGRAAVRRMVLTALTAATLLAPMTEDAAAAGRRAAPGTRAPQTSSSASRPTPARPTRRAAVRRTASRPTAARTTTATRRAAGRPTATAKTPARAPRVSRSRAATSAAERRARVARARAAERARTLREASTPRFRTDADGREVPDIRAEAAIIYNPATNEVLFQENAQEQRSIASITKVMTALVHLETQTDPATEVLVDRADVTNASTTYLRRGYIVTTEDLLHLLLIGSDNAAARALARVSPYGTAGFIARMNEKAAELGLSDTRYADPSGLVADNVSSAYDMARLIAYASADPHIGGIMRKAQHVVHAGRRAITVSSTNQLVRLGDLEVMGGKTGFIRRSGYCLATLLRMPQTGQEFAVVVLGARSNVGRFWETRHLFNWLASRTSALLTPGQSSQSQDDGQTTRHD